MPIEFPSPFISVPRSDGSVEAITSEFGFFGGTHALMVERGHQAGGHSWGALAEIILERQLPELGSEIRFDCEGDTFVAIGSEANLQSLLREFVDVMTEREKLVPFIEAAEARGAME